MYIVPFLLDAMDHENGILVLLVPPKQMLMDQGPFMLFEVLGTGLSGAFWSRGKMSRTSVRGVRTLGVCR